MKEIYTTSDAGEKAFLKSLFQDVGIPLTFSNAAKGEQCQVMVSDADFEAACEIIDQYLDDLDAEEEDDDEE